MRTEPPPGPGERAASLVLALILLLFACAWLSLARDDLRRGVPVLDAVTLSAPAPVAPSNRAALPAGAINPAPAFLPVAGAPAPLATAPPPSCVGPLLSACPGRIHTLGSCQWECLTP